MVVTLEELYKEITNYVNNNLYLNSIDIIDYHDPISTNNIYPVLWMQPNGITLGENVCTYKMRIVIIDRLSNDNTIARILSDTCYAFEDLISYYQNNNESLSLWVTNPTQNITPIIDMITDKVAGWGGVVSFNCAAGKDFSTVPMRNLD